jgi:hypothetical protein
MRIPADLSAIGGFHDIQINLLMCIIASEAA